MKKAEYILSVSFHFTPTKIKAINLHHSHERCFESFQYSVDWTDDELITHFLRVGYNLYW